MRLTIQTERLTLRPPEHADAEALARGLGDREVTRMTSMAPFPYPVEAAEGWIALDTAARRRGQAVNFVIVGPEVRVCGGIGVFKRRPDAAEWEVGYWVAKPCWGRGIASEALAAVIPWARGELGVERLTAGYFEDNPASRRVLEKAGFRPAGGTSDLFSMGRGERATCIGMARDLAPAVSAA